MIRTQKQQQRQYTSHPRS